MAQSIYGGRIDNEFDQRLLNTFLERLFTTSSFDSEFKLALKVDGHKDIKMPDGIRSAQTRSITCVMFSLIHSEPLALLCSGLSCIKCWMSACDCVRRREEFIHWVEMLPDTQTPSWLGLPSNAEKVLLTTQGTSLKRVFTPELTLLSVCLEIVLSVSTGVHHQSTPARVVSAVRSGAGVSSASSSCISLPSCHRPFVLMLFSPPQFCANACHPQALDLPRCPLYLISIRYLGP